MLEKVIYYDKRPPHIEKLLIEYAKPGIDLKFYEPSYGEAGSLEEAEAILAHSRGVTREIIDRAPNLKIIQVASVGYNQHDIEYAREKGIYVCNCAGGASDCVAEMVIGLMLSLTRRITQLSEKVRQGEWHNWTYRHDTHTIIGKTLGVIGLGAIGGLVANAAVGLGMQVVGCDPFITVNAAWSLSRAVRKADNYDEIYADADYITIHVPSTPDTKGMINAETIAKMKDGVRIINLARGDLVDNAAVKAALASGKVACYVTDFPSDELLDVEGVIAIPHLGASTPESEENCASMAAAQLIDYLENGNIKNSVNYPATYMARSAANRIVVLHENVPTMLAQVLTVLSNDNINIENMVSCSKGNNACSLFDTDAKVSEKAAADIRAIQGVRRITVIEG